MFLFNQENLKQLTLLLSAFVLICLALPGQANAQYNDPVVELQTTKGNIYIRVYRGLVPRTATNFLDLVNRGFYSGTVFHRIESWCIQGGSPGGNPNGNFVDPQTGNVRYIPLEINRRLSHGSPGVVAMARSSNPNSASCQFYILKQPMRQLDGQYAIFGKVLQGASAVMNMRRGDQILNARIVQSQRSQPTNQGSGQKRTKLGPVQKFDPPTDIPDSGF